MSSTEKTGAPKDYPVQINNHINNYASEKKDEKKSGHIPGRSIYLCTELVLHYGLALRYPEAYVPGLVAGAAFGLYKGYYQGDCGTFGLGARATTFGKEGITTKLWMLAEEIGIKALAALKAAESIHVGGYQLGLAVPATWAFSLGSDLSREVCKELTPPKKAKT